MTLVIFEFHTHIRGVFNAMKGGDPMSSSFKRSVGSLFNGNLVEQSPH